MCLSTDDMIIYTENCKESTKILLELVNATGTSKQVYQGCRNQVHQTKISTSLGIIIFLLPQGSWSVRLCYTHALFLGPGHHRWLLLGGHPWVHLLVWSASQAALTSMYQIPFPESYKANADLSEAKNTQSVELAPKYQCSMPTWSFIDCDHLLLTRAALGGPHVSICRNCSLQVNFCFQRTWDRQVHNNNGYCRHQPGNMGSLDISATPRTGRRLLRMERVHGASLELGNIQSTSPPFSLSLLNSPSCSESNSLKPTERPPIKGIHNIDFINKNER